MRLRSLWFFIAPFSYSTALLAADAEWPRWRGPTADGRWNPPNVPKDFASKEPVQIWSMDIGKGYAGVTVADGRVYTMDRQTEGSERERCLCVKASTGELLWMKEWPVQYGSMDYGTGPRSSVTIHTGKAYALGATGRAWCFDATTGAVIWQRDDLAQTEQSKMPTWGFAASPVIHGKAVLLHLGGVTALDLATGKTLWTGGADSAGYCTPEVFAHRGRDYVAQWGPNRIEVLNATDGALRWSYDYKITYGVSIAQPIIRDGLLLVSGYWHGTKAFSLGAELSETKLSWENEKQLCGLMSAGLHKDGIVWMLDKTEGLSAFEMKSGRVLWQDGNTLTPKDRNPQMSLVWLDEAKQPAALLNAHGELVYVKLSSERAEELGRYQVIGKTWAHPGFTADHIFARSDTKLLAARLW